MSRISWDELGKRFFETGVDHGILFPIRYGRYTEGVAWNGLTAVNENPTGAEASPMYADNMKYLNLLSNEDFKATIESYSYPEEFRNCIGETEIARGVFASQQKRQHFGLCYRTRHGNDQDGADGGYKIHLLFDCLAGPSDKSYASTNDTPEANTFSWEISTAPVEIDGYKPTSSMELDSNQFRKRGLMNILRHLEDVLYGTDETNSRFPTISEITEIYELEMYIRDSDNQTLLDSNGNKIRSRVFA